MTSASTAITPRGDPTAGRGVRSKTTKGGAADRAVAASGALPAGVVRGEDLATRPSRSPDHAAENQALVALARAMVEAPHTVLQRVADAALLLCRAESAGVSLDESESGDDVFRWRATAGRLAPHLGGTIPRHDSPCGTAVDRNATLLMTRPARRYPHIADLGIPVAEVLLVPFGLDGTPVGAVWVVAHSETVRFDAEDARLVAGLARFAAVAAAGIENARLYERVQEQDRQKDEFLATLAHELRNPLAPVRTGLQVLKLCGSKEVADKTHAMMERQIGQMVRLVDDLLDVSRVSRGKVDLRRERITVHRVVADAVETARPHVEAAGQQLTVRLPDEPLVLHADPTRMAQVVGNLLTNAAKYTPNGGRIEVRAERAGPNAVVRVTDSGVGIPADMLPRVFDLFTQVGRSLDRAQGGLGIGLALVKRLVELHDGEVTAESAGPGRGSAFTVTLPLATGEPTVADRPVTPGPREPGRVRSLRVLVVDDNPDGADSLATLLGLSGHDCRTAYTGPDALTAASEYRPHLVLLDIGLPGMNGYDVARRLRTDPSLGRPALVAVTGWGTEDDKRRAKEAGFDDHLTKPAGPAELGALLARVPHGTLATGG